MARRLITADDVQTTPPGGVIDASGPVIITPLARDVARERDITFARGAQAPVPGRVDSLEERIRDVVATVLLEGGGDARAPRRPPVRLARGAEAVMERFAFPGPSPDQDVRTGDVVTGADGSPMGVGYMSLTRGSFEWTFDYDEVQVVLEGELQLGGDGGDRVARAGDLFFVPKGSTVTFGTPTWARFVYVTVPAEWGS